MAVPSVFGWQPVERDLQQVILILEQSQAPDSQTQKQVQEQLENLNTRPEFCRYLIYILGEMKDQPENVRAMSGLLLKNTVKQRWQYLPSEIHSFIKQGVFLAIGDDSALIRATVGIIITNIFFYEGTANWPELISTMLSLFQMPSFNTLDGALGALQKMCEDNAERFSQEEVYQLLRPCFGFFSSSSSRLRGLALNAVNSILLMQNETLTGCIDEFVQALFMLSTDEDREVQKQLCRALTLLVEYHVDRIEAQLPNIIKYMLSKTLDPDIDIALEACEFWLAFAENQTTCKTFLESVLPELFPVLLRCMKYTPDEIVALKGNVEDDANVPDRDEDIRPRFHKAKTHGGQINDDDDDEDEDDDGDDSPSEWSLRKCAAASLDVLATTFGDSCLPVLLPHLNNTIMSEEWEVQESGILAVGAVAEGCMTGMTPHLNELVPFLINSLSHKRSLVRSITCWTLSRYCHFVMEDGNYEVFKQLLAELLKRVLDNNKKVQEAACSAFATLEEEAREQLSPFLSEVIQTFVEAFKRYQAKNLFILYDAVGTLADVVGQSLAEPQYVQMLLVPVITKFIELTEDDRELYPLLECLNSITIAIRHAILPFGGPIFQKCIQLIHNNLQKSICAHVLANQLQQDIMANGIPTDAQLAAIQSIEPPEKDVLIVALDLLSELTEACGAHVSPFVQQTRMIEYVYFCLMDINSEVKQSSFALLGDLTKSCFQHVEPFVTNFLTILSANINPTNVSVCNNAVWAIGEIILRYEKPIREYLPNIIQPLILVLRTEQGIPKTLQENCAITIGRIGNRYPEEMVANFNDYARYWFTVLRNISDNGEKESAFNGLCMMVSANPAAVANHFIYLCDALCSWSNPPPHLRETFKAMLHRFKGDVEPSVWNDFMSHFPEQIRQQLYQKYGV